MNERNSQQENTEEFYNELQQATQERANEPEKSKKISWFAMIIKIIIFPLTIISLALSGIGLLFAILQIISNVCKKNHAPVGLEARFCLRYGLAGMIATGLFFITKKTAFDIQRIYAARHSFLDNRCRNNRYCRASILYRFPQYDPRDQIIRRLFGNYLQNNLQRYLRYGFLSCIFLKIP